MKKKSIVKIDYSDQKGLKFEYNFQDLSTSQKYFRHLIIIYTKDVDMAKRFISNYYKKMRAGDIFSILYTNRHTNLKFKHWKQKKCYSNFDVDKYLIDDQIYCLNREQIMQIAQQQSQNLLQPLSLNIIVDKIEETQWFQQKIKEKRLHNKFSFISTFFGRFTSNKMSVTHGINYLTIQKNSIDTIVPYHLGFIYQSSMLFAKISIECINGQIQSIEEDVWRNVNFNKIQKKYYGPSAEYQFDSINFINEDMSNCGYYQLKIDLQFKCFNNVNYFSRKNITIEFKKNKKYMKTFNRSLCKKLFYPNSEIQLQENPFNSEIYVCFKKNIKPKQIQQKEQKKQCEFDK